VAVPGRILKHVVNGFGAGKVLAVRTLGAPGFRSVRQEREGVAPPALRKYRREVTGQWIRWEVGSVFGPAEIG
jgi:hypothetical protein